MDIKEEGLYLLRGELHVLVKAGMVKVDRWAGFIDSENVRKTYASILQDEGFDAGLATLPDPDLEVIVTAQEALSGSYRDVTRGLYQYGDRGFVVADGLLHDVGYLHRLSYVEDCGAVHDRTFSWYEYRVENPREVHPIGPSFKAEAILLVSEREALRDWEGQRDQ